MDSTLPQPRSPALPETDALAETARIDLPQLDDGALSGAILDQLGDAVSIVVGTIRVYVNDAYLRLYGLSDRAEAVGRPIYDRVSPDQKEAVVARALALQRGEQPLGELVEYRVFSHDGQEHVVQVRGMPITYLGRQASLSIQRDITDRVQAEEELKRILSLHKATLESTADGILVVDLNGNIVNFNTKFLEMWGLTPEALREKSLGEKFRSVLDQLTDPDEFLQRVRALYADASQESLDTLRLKDGRVFERYSLSHRLGDQVIGRVWSFRDVTGRYSLEAQLRHRAFHDGLTGLSNRALFTDRLDHAIALCRRAKASIFVLFLDLDDFKGVNDRFGHGAGDRVLAVIARRIADSLRSADTAARLGGDEFAVVLEGLTALEDAVKVAERILSVIRAPLFIEEREIVVEASIGIAQGDGTVISEGLIGNADIAMYAAKAAGKGRIHVYEDGMHRQVAERQTLIADLRNALARGELVVHYQPGVELATGRMVAAEALVRWNHPTRGLLSPNEFIHLAEDSAMIGPIGEFVLAEACGLMAHWQRRFPSSFLIMGVNVSARQLKIDSFAQTVNHAILADSVDPRRLLLEITESAVLEEPERGVKALHELKALGVSLALDDFGTGYSSLSYLKDLPIDVLKIDRSFIGNIASSKKEALLTEATIALGHQFGLRIVAEGIEHPDQLEKLIELQCEFGQGFLFSPPLTREELDKFVEARSTDLGLRAA